MKNNFVLVFDIGSLKLRSIFAGCGLNNTFNIRGYKEYDYERIVWNYTRRIL